MPNPHCVIVISVDAMITEDLKLLATLPNMGALLERAARVNRMRTIYPSLTHPVHASLITGCPPETTGVTRNEIFDLSKQPFEWYNRLDQIRCPTLFHVAHEAGLNTAVAHWPMLAGGSNIVDELIPEIMGSYYHDDASMQEAFLRYGSPSIMDTVFMPNFHWLRGGASPEYDIHAAHCAADMLRLYRPHYLFTHWGMVDHQRHDYGVFAPQVDDALRMVDEWLGLLVKACWELGIEDETDFIVLSDHGQMDMSRAVCLNVELAERGWIRLNPDGSIASWDAFVASCGSSAQLFWNEDVKPVVKSQIESWLHALPTRDSGVSRVMTPEETHQEYNLRGDFAFMLETDGTTAFADDVTGAFFTPLHKLDYRTGCATHGHMPQKGPQPPFLGAGPSFRSGVVVESGSILDVAPTLAALNGLGLPCATGKPMRELLTI